MSHNEVLEVRQVDVGDRGLYIQDVRLFEACRQGSANCQRASRLVGRSLRETRPLRLHASHSSKDEDLVTKAI